VAEQPAATAGSCHNKPRNLRLEVPKPPLVEAVTAQADEPFKVIQPQHDRALAALRHSLDLAVIEDRLQIRARAVWRDEQRVGQFSLQRFEHRTRLARLRRAMQTHQHRSAAIPGARKMHAQTLVDVAAHIGQLITLNLQRPFKDTRINRIDTDLLGGYLRDRAHRHRQRLVDRAFALIPRGAPFQPVQDKGDDSAHNRDGGEADLGPRRGAQRLPKSCARHKDTRDGACNVATQRQIVRSTPLDGHRARLNGLRRVRKGRFPDTNGGGPRRAWWWCVGDRFPADVHQQPARCPRRPSGPSCPDLRARLSPRGPRGGGPVACPGARGYPGERAFPGVSVRDGGDDASMTTVASIEAFFADNELEAPA